MEILDEIQQYCHIYFQYFLVSSENRKSNFFFYYLDHPCEILNFLYMKKKIHKKLMALELSFQRFWSIIHNSS